MLWDLKAEDGRERESEATKKDSLLVPPKKVIRLE